MTALSILLIVILSFILLGQIPLAVAGSYRDNQVSAWVKIGPGTITLLPSGSKKQEQKKEKPIKTKETKKKMTGPQIISLALDLLPVVKDAIVRLFGAVSMDQFHMVLILAGIDDPAESAIRYGQGSALLTALWAPLVDTFHIQDGNAQIDVDFTSSDMHMECAGKLSIRLGQVVSILVALATRGLIIFLRHRRQNKLREADS